MDHAYVSWTNCQFLFSVTEMQLEVSSYLCHSIALRNTRYSCWRCSSALTYVQNHTSPTAMSCNSIPFRLAGNSFVVLLLLWFHNAIADFVIFIVVSYFLFFITTVTANLHLIRSKSRTYIAFFLNKLKFQQIANRLGLIWSNLYSCAIWNYHQACEKSFIQRLEPLCFFCIRSQCFFSTNEQLLQMLHCRIVYHCILIPFSLSLLKHHFVSVALGQNDEWYEFNKWSHFSLQCVDHQGMDAKWINGKKSKSSCISFRL